jgi:transmembrane sensor
MTNYENVIYLLKKYTAGEASEEEIDELFFWLRKGDYDTIIHEELKKLATGTVKDANYDPAYWESTIQRVLQSDPVKLEAPVRRLIPWRRMAVAICLLIAMAGGLYYMLPARKKEETVKASPGPHYKNDVKPGKEGAILTLADGSTIVLDSAANGDLSVQGTVKVTKVNGTLSYDHVNGKEGTAAQQPMYNLLSTPKGRQFQLVLPDGSKVWLNALSSIRYPTAFLENHRTVQLTGEAYFEIAKDASKPFHVEVPARQTGKEDLDVQALGTQFNINAYNDEPAILATLIEGSVKLSAGNDSKIIVPGQQGIIVSRNEPIKLKMADVEQVLAWKNGYFILNGTSIQAVMRQLTRWYDVEVVYKGNFEGDDFAGEVPRTDNLSKVLEMLELTDVVHFAVEGKTVTVSQ